NATSEWPNVAFILVMRPPYSCTWRSKAIFTSGEISFVVSGSILAIIIFFLSQDYESKKLLRHDCSCICFLPVVAEIHSYNQAVSYHVCLHDKQIQEKSGFDQNSYIRSAFRN